METLCRQEKKTARQAFSRLAITTHQRIAYFFAFTEIPLKFMWSFTGYSSNLCDHHWTPFKFMHFIIKNCLFLCFSPDTWPDQHWLSFSNLLHRYHAALQVDNDTRLVLLGTLIYAFTIRPVFTYPGPGGGIWGVAKIFGLMLCTFWPGILSAYSPDTLLQWRDQLFSAQWVCWSIFFVFPALVVLQFFFCPLPFLFIILMMFGIISCLSVMPPIACCSLACVSLGCIYFLHLFLSFWNWLIDWLIN